MNDYLQNLHTHCAFDDGKDEMEKVVQKAIALGFHSLGFSCHSPMAHSKEVFLTDEKIVEYFKTLDLLKRKYEGAITLYRGIERDCCSLKTDYSPYDFVIGTVHYFNLNGEMVGFDRNAQTVRAVIDKYFEGDGLKYAKAYYEAMAKMPTLERTDIVGHFDLIAKHSESERFFDEESAQYRRYAIDAIDCIMKTVCVFEVNTGAMARGYRTTPYPAPFIMRALKNRKARLIISSDCHDAEKLNYGFSDALKYLESFGFKEVYYFKNGQFEGAKL